MSSERGLAMSATAQRGIVIEFRKPTGPLDSPLGHELRRIEERITNNEGDSIQARWEFGRALLRQRKGKQLPKGLPAAIVKEHSISLTEITLRMQFAEQFITKQEVLNAVEDFRSWRQIARKALPKTPRPSKPNTFEERMTNRVTRMINETMTPTEKTLLAQILADASQQLSKEQATK
jgi:glycyl-tRNA synthetase beta subunit